MVETSFLGENRRVSLNPGVGKDFLGKTQKALIIKEKKYQIDYQDSNFSSSQKIQVGETARLGKHIHISFIW